MRLYTSDDPAQAGAIGTVALDGTDSGKLAAHLWDTRRIIVTPIEHAEFEGLRVTPNVYTTLEEVDTFAAAMEGRQGAAHAERVGARRVSDD